MEIDGLALLLRPLRQSDQSVCIDAGFARQRCSHGRRIPVAHRLRNIPCADFELLVNEASEALTKSSPAERVTGCTTHPIPMGQRGLL